MNAILIALALMAAEPKLTGPDDPVPVGRSVWLELEGVSISELQNGDVKVFPSGKDADLRLLQDLRGMILIWFQPNEAPPGGQYDILVAVSIPESETVAHLKLLDWAIKVGDAPNPPPGPDPPDPPNPPARVALIYESEDSNQEFATLTNQIRDASLPLLMLDKDSKDEDGQTPPLLASAIREIGDRPLPCVVAYLADGSVAAVESLPATLQAVKDLFAKWGVK